MTEPALAFDRAAQPAPASRIVSPRPPEPARPYRFPVIATIAPVVVAVAIFAVTASPFALVFAALGPVSAVATLLDSRWSARRLGRREAARFASDLLHVRERIDAAHAVEIVTIEERSPAAAVIAERSGGDPYRWKAGPSSEIPVALGRGSAPSRLELERATATAVADSVREHLVQLDRHAATLRDAPVVVDAALGIGIAGRGVLATALARALVMQVAWSLPPSHFCLRVFPTHADNDDRGWIAELPHRTVGEPRHGASVVEFVDAEGRAVAVVAQSELDTQLPGSCAVVISTAQGTATIVQHPERNLRRSFRPGLVSRDAARAWAIQMRADASREGLTTESSRLPDAVSLESLLGESSHHSGAASLACDVAVGQRGAFTLDLVAHGPHAVVGGTTGSGKSELLIAWVLAMAHAHPPQAVTFLLIDFKGGSAFASLESLPHTVGIITDLGESEAARALESMRAELKFRERKLAQVGARSIDDTTMLPRLVIVVDEFAAMIADFPDLHVLFADIAARGRSLGVHLVLCTQRPAGVVRDGVLANADLRVSLRVNNRADSIAVVGSDAASNIPVSARGRAVVSLGGDDATLVQFALATGEAHERVRSRWRVDAPPRRPWCEPLPAVVAPGEVDDRAFALVDLPHEQRRADAIYDPSADGHLLVLGMQSSGKSHALEALAAQLGVVQRITRDPGRAWDAVLGLAAELDGVAPMVERAVLIDDIDALVPRMSGDHRPVFIELLCRVLREGGARGIRMLMSAQRLTPELQATASLMPARLLLRHASRQDLVLAGGEGASYRMLPVGGGLWKGDRVQVVLRPLPPADIRPAREVPLSRSSLAVVTPTPAPIAARLSQLYRAVTLADCTPETLIDPPPGTALVGDADEWQSRWGALAALRGKADVVFNGCTIAEFRALSRSRHLPPPLAADPHLAWIIRDDGTVGRCRLP